MTDAGQDPIEIGLSLLRDAGTGPVTVKRAMDVIEGITNDPATQRKIIDRGRMQGLVASDDATGGGLSLSDDRGDARIEKREGPWDCRRCGREVDPGHWYVWRGGELGPFGPKCVRKVLGRG